MKMALKKAISVILSNFRTYELVKFPQNMLVYCWLAHDDRYQSS